MAAVGLSEMTPPSEMTDLGLAEERNELKRVLRWRPRSREAAVARAERRLATAKRSHELTKAHLAEAVFKSHRYRWIPFLAEYWRDQLRLRSEAEKAARARILMLEAALARAQERERRHRDWILAHSHEIARKRELDAEWNRRASRLGRERVAEMQRQGHHIGHGTAADSAAWARQQGEAELRRRIAAQRQQRQREEQERQAQARSA